MVFSASPIRAVAVVPTASWAAGRHCVVAAITIGMTSRRFVDVLIISYGFICEKRIIFSKAEKNILDCSDSEALRVGQPERYQTRVLFYYD